MRVAALLPTTQADVIAALAPEEADVRAPRGASTDPRDDPRWASWGDVVGAD